MQKRFDHVQNKQGNALQGVRVTVKNYPAGTLASIYAEDGTDLIGGSYVTTNGKGYYEYYAADGRYTEEISGPGIETTIIQDVLIEDATADLADPTDDTQGDALVAVKLEASGSVATTQHARNESLPLRSDFSSDADHESAADAAGAQLLASQSRFKQSGTGATERTVQDKERDIVSVMDFIGNDLSASARAALVSGMKAGTSSTDLSAYLQRAVDAVKTNAGGGQLYFPHAVYTYGTTLTTEKPVCLYSEYEIGTTGSDGPKGACLNYTGTGTAIKVDGSSSRVFGFKMRGFRVRCDSVGATKGLDMDRCSEFDILDCHFIGLLGTAVALNACDIVNIERCDFNANTIGVDMQDTVGGISNYNVSISGCNFFDNSTAQIRINTATGLRIHDNQFEKSPSHILFDNSTGDAFLAGMDVYANVFLPGGLNEHALFKMQSAVDGNSMTLRQSRIRGNFFDGGAASPAAIVFNKNTNSAPTFIARMIVADNNLWSVTTAGITSDFTGAHVYVENNEVFSGFSTGSVLPETTGTITVSGISMGTWRGLSQNDTLEMIGDIRLTKNIRWLSSTNFQGTFDHDNTANRTYTFPNWSGPVMVPQTVPIATGSNRQVTTAESGTQFTNEGATARQDFTLPAATAGKGPYTFTVMDADGIRVIPGSGDTIRIAGTVSAAGSSGRIDSTTVGDSVTLQAVNDTEWVAIALVGAGWAVTT